MEMANGNQASPTCFLFYITASIKHGYSKTLDRITCRETPSNLEFGMLN